MEKEDSILINFLKTEAEKKNISVKQRLIEIATNSDKCQFTTHVGKFANPAVKDINLYVPYKENSKIKYVITETAKTITDIIVSSAQYMTSARFLNLTLEDNKTVYQHFKEETNFIKEELNKIGIDYQEIQEIRNLVLKIKFASLPQNTDTLISQVYFPINKENYHLLSILPNSSLALTLGKKIIKENQKAREIRKSKSNESYQKLLECTVIGHGGNNPRNISHETMKFSGTTYMLPSFPPIFNKDKFPLPKNNFFTDCIKLSKLKKKFQILHKNYLRHQHNKDAREAMRNAEFKIIDFVLQKAYILRDRKLNWTDSTKLPLHQKIWLDRKYENITEDVKEDISEEFATWINDSYNFFLKEEAIQLGEVEHNFLVNEIKKIL